MSSRGRTRIGSDLYLKGQPEKSSAAITSASSFEVWRFPIKTFVEPFGVDVEQLVDRVKESWLQKFLAALLFASCGTRAAKLVASGGWLVEGSDGRDVFRLPAERKRLDELFEAIEPTNLFFNRQAFFCPVSIHIQEKVFVQPDRERLPYLGKKPLIRGSFGEVSVAKAARN